MQLAEGETIIYSGRDDDNHRKGVGILMSIIAAGSLMEWTRSMKGLFKPDSIPDTLGKKKLSKPCLKNYLSYGADLF